MKVCKVYITYLPSVGGIEMLMHGLARKLVEKGIGVEVVTSNKIMFRCAMLKPVERIDGVRVRRIKAYNILGYRYSFFTPGLGSILKTAGCDIVHVFSFLPAFMTNAACVLAKMWGIPLVVTPIYHPHRCITYRGRLQKLTMTLFDRFLGMAILRLADAVTALTEAEAAVYRARGLRDIHVIPEGVSLPENGLSPKHIQEFKNKFGLCNSQLVLSVGRLAWYKGLDLLVSAFMQVKKSVPRVKLVIVGADWGYRQRLESYVRELGLVDDVVFTGSLSEQELHCAYASADVVVHPSLFETFCRIALEAWCYQKPVIAFDRVGEPVTASTGILVPYRDVDKLAEAIIQLLCNKALARQLGLNGYRTVEEKFRWEIVADKFIEVYRQVKRF